MTQAGTSEPPSPSEKRLRLHSIAGSSGPGSPGSEDKRQTVILGKAQAAKALQLQRQEIRVGEEWSEFLKLPSNRTPEAMMNFWEEVKFRLLKRFGSLHLAVGGETSVSFIKFCELLRTIHFPLHQSTCRNIFGQVCAGHREMPVDSFKHLLMERTIQSMRFVMEGWNGKQARVRSHIRTFIRRLAEVDERQREQAVDRFQRKLTASFIRSFWELLRRRNVETLSQAALARVLMDPEASGFQDQEISYMLRILLRMSSAKASFKDGLPLSYYVTGLTLVSMIPTKGEKLELIFEAFDLDADRCLLYKQIFELCHCVSVLKVMVEESARGSPDEYFQAELSQQEGQRSYECIRWHLQRRGIPGDIVSFPELRAAWETQPSLQALLPGWVQIRWAAQVIPGEDFSHLQNVSPAGHAAKSRRREDRVECERECERPKTESSIFRSVLTQKFSKSLRDLGNQRLAELTRDFEHRGEAKEEAHQAPKEIVRAKSAPSMARPKPGDKTEKAEKAVRDVASLPPQRWGKEAGNRFRIYAVAKTGPDRQLSRRRPDPGQILPYKCQLCFRMHKLCPGHDVLQ